jgi:hypothetical protein
MKKKSKNKTKKQLFILLPILLLLIVGIILIVNSKNKEEIQDNIDDYSPDNVEIIGSKPCDIEDSKLLSAINTLQKQTALYKYFKKEMPLSTSIDSATKYADEDACLVKTKISNVVFNYVYIKLLDEAYGYSSEYGINKGFDDYNSKLLYFYVKDFLIDEDFNSNYFGYGLYPIKYDGGDKFYIEVKEYNGENELGGELIAMYIINLNTKKYVVEN